MLISNAEPWFWKAHRVQDAVPIEVAVIIVNYGVADLCIDAVESVRARGHGGRRVEIHVVDNASPGDDADRLARAHRERAWSNGVTLHLGSENLGFGRGNNLVLEKLAKRSFPPEKVFFLNPDASLQNDALDILAGFLDRHPRAGCAGVRISGADGEPVSAAFRFPSVVSEFSDALAFGPVARLFSAKTAPLPPSLPTRVVDWVSGAAFMLRSSALRDVQGFDPDYFLYFEEVDLMKRLTKRGWQIWHVEEAHVRHIEGASTNIKRDPHFRGARPDYWYDSWLVYHVSNHGRFMAWLFGGARLIGWGGNQVICLVRGRPSLAPKRYLDSFWRRVLRPLLGLPAQDAS